MNKLHITTSFHELIRLAKILGKARQSGDQQAIATAQADHDAYRDLCLKADTMTLGITCGELYGAGQGAKP